jgi:hypothetical protein
MITTIHGDMDKALLDKREGTDENDNEIVNWVEYYLGKELVHRSVHVHLKRGMFASGIAANFA